MVSVTITFEILKLRYYVYCALFDLSCKLLLSIYLISAMCYTYYSTYYSSIFCLIYYRVVVKINLYQCQCQCQCQIQNIIQHKHFAGTALSLETKYFTIHIFVCNSKLRKSSFFVLGPRIRTIKCSTKTLT